MLLLLLDGLGVLDVVDLVVDYGVGRGITDFFTQRAPIDDLADGVAVGVDDDGGQGRLFGFHVVAAACVLIIGCSLN